MNSAPPRASAPATALTRQRVTLLHQLQASLEGPMAVLGIVWLALLIFELTTGGNRAVEAAGTVIWIIFLADFALKFALAPRKLRFLRRQWLMALSLLAPALRMLRLVQMMRLLHAARAARGLSLLTALSSLNQGMRALRAAMGRRGFGYVTALTIAVTLAGAAGMLAFENEVPAANGIHSYGTALWWTAMLITTIGSEYWPRTPEGRLLCVILGVYALAVVGYIAASLASFFIDRDAADEKAEVVGAKEIAALRAEIRALREAMQAPGKRG